MDADTLLEVRDLRLRLRRRPGTWMLDGVNLSVGRRQTVALVGGSGAGKSLTALAILRLIPSRVGELCGGRVLFRDPATSRAVDLLELDPTSLRGIRGNGISIVFQDPSTALNPVMTIQRQIVEVLRIHRKVSRRVARCRADELLHLVGLARPTGRFNAYAHHLSGGMRQRAVIAMALACEPALLIADEPTSSLDVTVQGQIMDLLMDCRGRFDMSILLITHDMGVVAQTADQLYVMSAGRIVESGDVERIFDRPQHPCTRKLLDAAVEVHARQGAANA